ncbi:MAG: hypothetical protein AAF399_22475, partial [Bacteroidota bacterium]
FFLKIARYSSSKLLVRTSNQEISLANSLSQTWSNAGGKINGNIKGGTSYVTHSLVMLGYVAVATAPANNSSLFDLLPKWASLRAAIGYGQGLVVSACGESAEVGRTNSPKNEADSDSQLGRKRCLTEKSRRIATAIYWDMLFLVTSDVPHIKGSIYSAVSASFRVDAFGINQ